MPAESLVPGYRLVERFGPDSAYETRPSANAEGTGDEEEVEEEVEYVTLEISGIADVGPDLLTSYRLIGLDTPTPFLQLSSSGTIFKGRHHKLLGTELLFTRPPGDSDPSARSIALLGTTEKRIVFSPVEIRNPASSSTSVRTSKGEAPGKESISVSKKGKKRVTFWSNGIEDVVGTLNARVSKPSAPDEQDAAVESDPNTRSKEADKKTDEATPDDGDDDMYATEDGEDVGEEDREDGTFETDLPLRKKRKQSRNVEEDSRGLSVQSPTTMPSISATPVAVAELIVAQGEHQPGAPPTDDDILMAIDPALEALHVSSNQPAPRASGSGSGI